MNTITVDPIKEKTKRKAKRLGLGGYIRVFWIAKNLRKMDQYIHSKREILECGQKNTLKTNDNRQKTKFSNERQKTIENSLKTKTLYGAPGYPVEKTNFQEERLDYHPDSRVYGEDLET